MFRSHPIRLAGPEIVVSCDGQLPCGGILMAHYPSLGCDDIKATQRRYLEEHFDADTRAYAALLSVRTAEILLLSRRTAGHAVKNHVRSAATAANYDYTGGQI